MSPADGTRTAQAACIEPVVQLCAFVVGTQGYAVDLMRVAEIASPIPVMPVAHAPGLEGVARLRWGRVPVLDLRRRLGVPVTPATKRTKLLVCKIGGWRVGLVVDAITGIVRIPRSEIRPPPETPDGMGARLHLGLCGPPGGSMLLLNIKALFELNDNAPADVRMASPGSPTTGAGADGGVER